MYITNIHQYSEHKALFRITLELDPINYMLPMSLSHYKLTPPRKHVFDFASATSITVEQANTFECLVRRHVAYVYLFICMCSVTLTVIYRGGRSERHKTKNKPTKKCLATIGTRTVADSEGVADCNDNAINASDSYTKYIWIFDMYSYCLHSN